MPRMKKLILFICCCLVILPGCRSEAPAEARPLLQINDRAVDRQEFFASFEKTLQKDQPLSREERQELMRAYLVQLIDRELIHAEAKRLNITVTESAVENALQSYRQDYPGSSFETMLEDRGMTLENWREELHESLIMETLLEQTVYARIEISDMEVAAYYEENREQFDRPAQVRARQIVVASEEEGQRILGLLQKGQPFAELAAEYSLSPDGQQGGDLGFFGKGEMPQEFDAVVFDLPLNRLSKLIKSEYGYHIFLVEEKRKAARLSKEEAEAEIRAVLETIKREELYHEWLQELRARATINVDWAQLETTDTTPK